MRTDQGLPDAPLAQRPTAPPFDADLVNRLLRSY
jgi:hypothetical protein